ncbi:MAG TPA: DoxX family protein [Gemmatimonadaceae bacterium]|nr:DoxX family protein [Gemmatimonadaceae bacterium]
MTGIAVVPPQRLGLGLTILRIVIGIVFIVHGAQKLFVFGIGGVTAGFAQMHIPLPMVAAPVVAIVEFVGGIALVAGFFTRIAAILLAIDMAGAILFVHGRNGFFMPMGYEFALSLMGACVALAIAGPGDYSVDNRRRL